MNTHKDDRGWSWWDVFPLRGGLVNQVNLSWMHPGAIKGIHAHLRQSDFWFCAAGCILVVTCEARKASAEPDGDALKRRVLYPGDPAIKIPPGVWHGCRAIGGGKALLGYGGTEQYDPSDPDEIRLPWDSFGADVWEMQPK